MGGGSQDPYIRGAVGRSDEVVVELGFVGEEPNNFAELQQAWLKVFGWQLDGDQALPYQKSFSTRATWNLAALEVVAMLRTVFNIRTEVWFRFSGGFADEAVTYTSGLWHYVSSNSVVCLPRQHFHQTVQGLLNV